MLEGWRGKIGRAVPTTVVRGLLDRSLITSAYPLDNIAEIRANNYKYTSEIAAALGISFIRNSSSGAFCVSAKEWSRLAAEFDRLSVRREQISSQFSYAAQSVWSIGAALPGFVRSRRETVGLGAIWQVFAGEICPASDAQDFEGNIDAVYTWVDSSDEEWRRDYRTALAENQGSYSESSAGLGRFTSRDELLFSLRSMEMNAPWIDRIYIVTAGQRPKWLVENHPKLVLVDHSDIFASSKSCLPTFNSHAIESQLVNIKGLKEHFLYVNDDVFFGKPLHPNTFYGPDGQSKYAMSGRHFAVEAESSLAVNQAAKNNRRAVVDEFGRTTSRKFKHVAHPQRLTVLRHIAREYSEEIVELSMRKFRSEQDLSIPSSLAHQFAGRMGLGYPSDVTYKYLEIGSNDFYLDVLRFLRTESPEMYCINEVLSNKDEINRGVLIRRLLETKFPVKSSFEK